MFIQPLCDKGLAGSDPRCDDRSTDRFVAAQAATNRGRYRQPADPSRPRPAFSIECHAVQNSRTRARTSPSAS
jgi:hypothetical protein